MDVSWVPLLISHLKQVYLIIIVILVNSNLYLFAYTKPNKQIPPLQQHTLDLFLFPVSHITSKWWLRCFNPHFLQNSSSDWFTLCNVYPGIVSARVSYQVSLLPSLLHHFLFNREVRVCPILRYARMSLSLKIVQ